MKKYRCTICEHVYDPEEGDPGNEIPPGTGFVNLPDAWMCPACGAMKADFEPLEE
jgi:rubredoxin